MIYDTLKQIASVYVFSDQNNYSSFYTLLINDAEKRCYRFDKDVLRIWQPRLCCLPYEISKLLLIPLFRGGQICSFILYTSLMRTINTNIAKQILCQLWSKMTHWATLYLNSYCIWVKFNISLDNYYFLWLTYFMNLSYG